MAGEGTGEPKQVGERIQRLRTELGLTQRQLAEPQYTAAYVSTLEAGKGRPSETALRYLAEKLGTSYEQLATGIPTGLRARLRLGLSEARRLLGTGEGTAADLLSDLLEQTVQLDLTDLRSEVLVALGDCALERGDLTTARNRFEEAEQLLAEEPLPRRVAAIRGRARTLRLAGELRYACYLLENTLDELNDQGLADPDALLLLYTTVLTLYLDMGAYERAGQAANHALELAPRVHDPVSVANLHRGVARTLAAQGRFEDAEAYLVKAQTVYQQWEIRTDLAHCHWMRGYLHTQHGRLPAAEAELEAARDMLRAAGAEFYALQVEVELADVWWRRGRGEEAADLLTGMLGDLGLGHGSVHAAAAHRLLGSIREEHADTDAAERHYRAAVALLEEAGASGDLADACRMLGDLLHRLERTDEAVAAYRQGLLRAAHPGTTTLGPAPAVPVVPPERHG
ncbi:tetratricopeptide (TPR) repeat protein [Kitasatospora sp. GAS204A]|uniref:helix-turn-helix domain-containing protein n=1 Tax=unclassified Kitasatospora TaxID=2633591 RepID=UPI0024772149|nr:helix-turn-helix transcriptional regulator [Kitasatospora sp. GAS204B]MDH6122357.1 tetratricopeptide (TPR) repeat protein [Kitasatospora sp. GAS204B]